MRRRRPRCRSPGCRAGPGRRAGRPASSAIRWLPPTTRAAASMRAPSARATLNRALASRGSPGGRSRDPQVGRVVGVPLAEAGRERRRRWRRPPSGICARTAASVCSRSARVGTSPVDPPPVEAHAVRRDRQPELGAESPDDVLVGVDPLPAALDDDAVGQRRGPGPAADPVPRLEHDHVVARALQPSTRTSVPPAPHPPRRSARSAQHGGSRAA